MYHLTILLKYQIIHLHYYLCFYSILLPVRMQEKFVLNCFMMAAFVDLS